jgi:hypothetical protein
VAREISREELPLAEEVDYAAVGRVAARVELVDIRLTTAMALINVDASDVASDWGSRAFSGYDVSAHELSDDGKTFSVRASFIVVHRRDWDAEPDELPELDPDDPPDVHVVAAYELSYSLSEGEELSDRDLQHFAVFNARFNAWPYWRELAQTATQRMRIPPLVIPVLRVPAIPATQATPSTELA